MNSKTYLTLVCLLALAWTNAFSQTQYIGPDGGDWFTPANWNNDLPANGNDALIGGGINVVISGPLTVDFIITNFGGITANGLVTNDGTISNSGSVTFSDGGGLANNGTFNNFNLASFGANATFTNESGASFTNGGIFTLPGTLVNRGGVTNNGTIDAASGTLMTEGSFDNSQTLTTESLTVSNGANFTNNFGSNLFITGAAALLQVDGTFNNLGNVDVDGTFNITGSFSNSVTVVNRGAMTIGDLAIFNNAGGAVTNEGSVENFGSFINGFQFINKGSFANYAVFNNNNLIDNQLGAVFTSDTDALISMGFGSKIQNAGSLAINGSLDSFGAVENSGGFTNSGTINSFSGSRMDNTGAFTNYGQISTNDQVVNNGSFINNGIVDVNGGSLWTNNANFTIGISGRVNVLQDFRISATGTLTNNGRFVNLVRTRNEGVFTNNAYLENSGNFTNATGGVLTNNELLRQLAGNLLNQGSLENKDNLTSDECSSISNDGSVNNTGSLTAHAIIFQRGTLSGTAVDCQGCYIHTGSDSNAPTVCQNGSFGADVNGDVKVYAPELIAFANFDSCSNFVYLANGADRPVFACSDIGSAIPATVVLKIPNTTDSLTCTAIITPTDVLEPQFDNCPKDIVVFTDQAGASADWVPPVFVDNCTATSVTESHLPGDVFPVGITGVTYQATDAYGNTNNCQFRVDVRQTPAGVGCTVDATGPTFIGCPTDITLVTTGTGANASWVAPTATDGCFPLYINTDFVPGQVFGVGSTTVVYTATDGNGNESTCSFGVAVNFDDPCQTDVTPPSFSNCPANIYRPSDAATGGAVAVWSEPGVFDLCSPPTVSATHFSGSVFLEGVTNVTYTATDGSGNSATCSFTITVGNDPCPGVASGPSFSNCPANISVEINGTSTPVNWTAPTAAGACTPINVNSNFSPGSVFQIGVSNVKYTASDAKGRTATCGFSITVQGNCSTDNEPPIISGCPSDITVASVGGSGVATWTSPTATDNCGLISFSSTFSPGASFPAGVTTVIYTAGDLFGNGSTCEFNVSVVAPPDCTTNAAPINLTTDLDPAAISLSWNSSLNADAYDVYLGTSNPPTSLVANNISGTSTMVSGLQGNATYYWYVVPKNIAGNAAGCSSSVTSFATAGGITGSCNKEVLFIAGSTSLNTSDNALKTRLESQGFTVHVVDDNLSTTTDADGKGLIVISSTTSSGNVNTKYRDVEVPVICYESWLFDDFKMTGTGSNYGTSGSQIQLTIENASHPIAAGLSGNVAAMSVSRTMSWGKPAASAKVIASLTSNTDLKAVFAYDAGDQMVGMAAPGKRIGLFFHNDSFDDATANGLAIFDAAVKWAAGIGTPGDACDDGNPNTFDDVLQADGCTCAGSVCDGSVTGFIFTDAAGNYLADLQDGGVYQTASLPAQYNIQALVSGTSESATFNLSGLVTINHTENFLPYDMAGTGGATFLTPGDYSLSVTLYTADNAGGNVCSQTTINFTITDCSPVQLVCESYINNDGWVNHDDCTVTVCQGDRLTLSVNPNGAQFSSMTGPNGFNQTSSGGNDFFISNSVDQSHAGVYHVDLIDGNGCPGSTDITVVVHAATPVAVCKNLTLQLTSIGQSVQFSGQDLDGGSMAGCNATIASYNASPTSYSQPGTYTATLTVTNSYGLSATCQSTVTVLAPACDNVTNGGAITKSCQGANILLNSSALPSGGSGSVEYLWISGTTDCNPDNMTPVAGAGSIPSLSVNAVSQTTYFIRCSRRAGCTDWNAESNCITVSPGDCAAPTASLKTGKIVIEQANSNAWYTVNFSSPFNGAPIVILGPPSANSTEQVIPRVRNVTASGFQFQLDEWEYLNGYHPVETLYYMAMMPGNHTINGVAIEAGSFQENHSWDRHNFQQAFSTAPVVLTTIASVNEATAITGRTRNVTSSGFDFRVQEELEGSHALETIHYIALTPGTFSQGGANFKVDNTSNSVTHNWYTINFGQNYSDPGFLASMQTYDGGDVCALRHRNLGGSSVQVKVEEEQAMDAETNHTTEVVGWVVFNATTTLNLGAASNEDLQLEAAKEEEHAVLYWTHNKGAQVDEYILEKSVDGGPFEEIDGQLSRGTNGTELYESYDLAPATGENIYRVKLIHLDGSVSYSATVSIHYADLIDFTFFPNPANEFVKINLEQIVGEKNVTITLYNNLGVVVKQKQVEEVYSKYHQLDIRQLQEGHYILWLQVEGRKPIAKQLVIGRI